MLDEKEAAAKARPTGEKKQRLRAFFLFLGVACGDPEL
jgi:hypothetical protein